MKTVVHITFQQSPYNDEDGKKKIFATPHSYDPTPFLNPGEIYSGKLEIEVPFPTPLPSDFLLAEVAALRKKQGEHVAECTKLEERIQSLLCIEAPKAGGL